MAIDLSNKTQHDTPFAYNGDATLTNIRFSDYGNVIFNVEEARDRVDTFNSVATVTMWSLDKNSNTGSIPNIQLGAERSFELIDNFNRLIGLTRKDDILVLGLWDTKDQRFLGPLSRDYSHRRNVGLDRGAVDRNHGRVAVIEDINDQQNSVELWDLTTAKLIRERSLDKTVEKPTVVHHGSYLGGGATFLRGGSLLLLGGAETQVSPARLLNVDDLSDNTSFGVPNQLWVIGHRFLLWSDKESPTEWDSENNITSRLSGLQIDDIKNVFVSPDFASIVVTSREGRVHLCTLAPPSSHCAPVIENASFTFQALGGRTFGVLTQEGSTGVYQYDGVQLALLRNTNFGISFQISFNPDCNGVFVWTEDGRVRACPVKTHTRYI